MELYELLKVVSEPSRLKILYCLYNKELCVGDLQEILGLSQANVSKHLKLLLSNNMVVKTKQSQKSLYNMDTDYTNKCLIFLPLMEVFEKSEDGKKIKESLKKIGV